MLLFVFPTDRVSEENQRASMGPGPCVASNVPQHIQRFKFNPSQITNVQEVSGTMTELVPV